MPTTNTLDLIVSVDWLASHIDDPDLVVVDVRPEADYDAGHIPGARNIDIYPLKILDSDASEVSDWVSIMEQAFQQLGITHEDRVVFYEDISGTSAARGVWLMHALSIGEGAVLDGGLSAWHAAGHPISTDPVEFEPSRVQATLNRNLFATADEILGCVNDEQASCSIIDTRNAVEWIQGTIPTARHLDWVNHLEPDGTFKPLDDLRKLYADFGLEPDEKSIAFCASGYRAAHTWVVLKALGYDNVSNYAPSWGEWGRRADLPVATNR